DHSSVLRSAGWGLTGFQKTLDLLDRPRHRARQPPQPGFLEQKRIFDADAGVRVLTDGRLHLVDERDVLRRARQRVERALTDVDAGLDGERHPRLEGMGVLADVVDVDADVVRGAM